jgi:hypothetical protein
MIKKKGKVEMNNPQHPLIEETGRAPLICGGNNLEVKPLRTETIILLYICNRLNKGELEETVKVWMQNTY